MRSFNAKGFAHLQLLLLVVFVLLAGLVGWRVYQNQHNSVPSVRSVSTVPTDLNSKSDLNTAASALDNANLNSSLNSSALDTDIKSLL